MSYLDCSCSRDAWLKGYSRQNRSIPPLRYEYVYRLKQELPHLHVSLNGGLVDKQTIDESLKKVDAVMLGRAAYQNPRLIHELGGLNQSYESLLHVYIDYIRENLCDQQVRRLIAPLVIALMGYHGAKSDRARLAMCRKSSEVRMVLDNLSLPQ